MKHKIVAADLFAAGRESEENNARCAIRTIKSCMRLGFFYNESG